MPLKHRKRTALVVHDKKTDELGVCFLEGPAEYVNEMFAKGPSKTLYGQEQTALIGASISDQELEKTTPVNEKQIRSIFPYAVATKMVDPLTTVDKTRIHDNIRRDGATKRALLFIAYFMMPEPPALTLGLNRKYATKEREKEHLTEIQDNAEYLDILEELINRDDEIDLFTREIEMVFAAHGYGRSVLVKQYDNVGYPKRLIPLSSPRLGNVWIDRNSWEFLGVEYKDYSSDKRILLAKDIIHYEVDDFNVTPNARYYGMASTETTMAIGERNRAANEIAMPEIMKRMFAPLMLVKSKNKSQAKLQQIRDAWKSGKTVFYNSDMEIVVVALPHDLDKLRDTVEEGSKQIFRDLTVPIGVGWSDDPNRATFQGSIIQWYESVLSFKRTQLSNVMWRQYYKPQLEMIYKDRQMSKVADQGGVMNYLIQNAINPTVLPFKIDLEFKNVKTTGLLDTFAALAQFGDRRYLLPDMIRDEAGLGKYNEEMNEVDSTISQEASTFSAMDNMMNTDTSGNTPQSPGASLTNKGGFGKGLPRTSGEETQPEG